MRVRALQKTYYDRRDRMPGETYEMDDREEMQAKLLQAIGTIEILPTQRPAVEARVVEAEADAGGGSVDDDRPTDPAAADDATEPPRRGRQFYRRRDMRAQR